MSRPRSKASHKIEPRPRSTVSLPIWVTALTLVILLGVAGIAFRSKLFGTPSVAGAVAPAAAVVASPAAPPTTIAVSAVASPTWPAPTVAVSVANPTSPIPVSATKAIAPTAVSKDGRIAVTAEDGLVRLAVNDISPTARFYTYQASGKTVRFFVLKSSDGVIRAALDACDVCFAAKKGYHQEGDLMVCNNCGNRFPSVSINEVQGGCNPVPLLREVQGNSLIIKAADLAAGVKYF
jgi:hypothetical protein